MKPTPQCADQIDSCSEYQDSVRARRRETGPALACFKVRPVEDGLIGIADPLYDDVLAVARKDCVEQCPLKIGHVFCISSRMTSGKRWMSHVGRSG